MLGAKLRRLFALGAGAVLALVQAQHSQGSESAVPAGKDGGTVVASAPVCPAEEFSSFLNAFAESEAIQRAFVRFPLKMQQLDLDAQPEPKPIVKVLNRGQARFPLMPLTAERKVRSLHLRIESLSANRARVTLFKSDTDHQVSYFFGKTSCWRLERIEDWSL